MPYKLWLAFKKSWKRPFSVVIIPYGPLPPWQIKFSLPFAIFLSVVWSAVTIWAGYIASQHVDYYITKADNKILQTKMAFIAEEIAKGKRYLDMTKQTEAQMRQALGMDKKNTELKNDPSGGARPSEIINFQKIIEKKAFQISESIFKTNINQIREASNQTLAGFQEIAWYMANKRNIYKATPSIWPTSGRLSSDFGYRVSPFNGKLGDFHSGIDISNSSNTPIIATADGVVRHAGWASGYGQTILIDHGFGYSTLYAHTAKVFVKEGQKVKKGEHIAGMGNTGRTTGCHLHYEVWHYGQPTNPEKFLKAEK